MRSMPRVCWTPDAHPDVATPACRAPCLRGPGEAPWVRARERAAVGFCVELRALGAQRPPGRPARPAAVPVPAPFLAAEQGLGPFASVPALWLIALSVT